MQNLNYGGTQLRFGNYDADKTLVDFAHAEIKLEKISKYLGEISDLSLLFDIVGHPGFFKHVLHNCYTRELVAVQASVDNPQGAQGVKYLGKFRGKRVLLDIAKQQTTTEKLRGEIDDDLLELVSQVFETIYLMKILDIDNLNLGQITPRQKKPLIT